MSAPEFIDHVTLRVCGEQIGVKSPGMDMSLVVARCYSCAATEEAEKITREAAE